MDRACLGLLRGLVFGMECEWKDCIRADTIRTPLD